MGVRDNVGPAAAMVVATTPPSGRRNDTVLAVALAPLRSRSKRMSTREPTRTAVAPMSGRRTRSCGFIAVARALGIAEATAESALSPAEFTAVTT